MATAQQLTITTTPQLIGKCTTTGINVWVHAGGTIYFGGSSSVTSSNGFRLDNNDKYSTNIYYGDEIWAVTNTGTQTLYVFTVVLP